MHAEQVCYGDSRLPLLLMPIPDPVFEHFAADPGGPLLHLPYEAANADSPVRAKSRSSCRASTRAELRRCVRTTRSST